MSASRTGRFSFADRWFHSDEKLKAQYIQIRIVLNKAVEESE